MFLNQIMFLIKRIKLDGYKLEIFGYEVNGMREEEKDENGFLQKKCQFYFLYQNENSITNFIRKGEKTIKTNRYTNR